MDTTTKKLALHAALALALALTACPSSGGGDGPTNGSACGNGELNGFELCDGPAFATGSDCAAYGLNTGQVACTAGCRLDFSPCSYQDYCTANNLYGNGACDACDALGGVVDPDCAGVCGADGTCGDTWEPIIGNWTCGRLGLVDPDCGVCGNRIREGNEVCDGTAFDPVAFQCTSYGFYGGALACGSNCQPDFDDCLASDCGDGDIEGLEACDGADFAGQTCADFGGVAGDLSCTSECTIDATTCVSPGCNNGVLEAPIEACDGADLGGATCESRGFVAGTLSCGETCSFDESACVAPGCDNGVKEDTEDCEYEAGVANLYGGTCETEGFLPAPGAVTCDPATCRYDTSTCVAAGCGNGVVEGPVETCEGDDTRACTQLGFEAGTATCGDECTWDTSACTGGCGDGAIDGAEACDGADLGGETCQGLGFATGQLGCTAGCKLDNAGCQTRIVECGDGRRDPGETCDGDELQPGLTCASVAMGTGTVTCGDNCVPDFSGCSVAGGDLCAAHGLNNNGVPCDPCDAWGGESDQDCICGSDGVCQGYWDTLAGWQDTCEVVYPGRGRDPDCVPYCGDGQIQAIGGQLAIEPCDGTMFLQDFNSCQKIGFSGGTLRCTADCRLDLTGCR